tara:strand:+ start:756 stop:1136 length:381 start_codon:yes stop_codon:yes gene_type:complete
MSHPSKIKGNKFERDCCKKAELFEIPAKRAWASDGRSLGLDSEVDIVVGDKEYNDEMHVQCKIRKRLPEYIFPKNNVIDSHLIREDRGETYIVLRYDDYLSEMRRYRQLKKKLELYEGSTKSQQNS